MRHHGRIQRILSAGIQHSFEPSSRPAQVINSLHMGSKRGSITHPSSLSSATSVILMPNADQSH